MKKQLISGLALCTVILFSACKKEDPIQAPASTSPDGTALKALFTTNTANGKQVFTIDATTGGTVTGSKGTKVYIPGGILRNPGDEVISGNVTVELIEIYDRASMVLLNKPTVGKLPNGDHATLKSGGEYYLRIHQNGVTLRPDFPLLVTLPASNTGAADFEMKAFDGTFPAENDLLWELAEDSVVNINDTTSGINYAILDGEWGWTNVDRFMLDPRPKTVIKAKLPSGYDNTNCEVFITYDGEPTALASLDTYLPGGYFSEHYGLIPIGLQVHFIAVTVINGQLNYAIQGAMITDGHIEQITTFTPISQAALATLINSLP